MRLELGTPKDFDWIYTLMESSFPKEEQRKEEEQRRLLDHPLYTCYVCRDDRGRRLGVLGTWTFSDFRYIEHFAVDPDKRDRGIGQTMLQQYLKLDKRPVVLEVDPPTHTMASRRIEFYRRQKFLFQEYVYWQPSLQKDGTQMQLYLMSYPENITKEQAETYQMVLNKQVYQFS